jgi:hypothetical protein
MRVGWVLLRLLGLAALAVLGFFLGSRLAAADEPATTTTTTTTVDARPNADPHRLVAPAGTLFGPGTQLRNVVPSDVQNPPHSPTPPGYPLGAPGGSYAPTGGGFSGMTLGPHF